jgi:hypothetical protein
MVMATFAHNTYPLECIVTWIISTALAGSAKLEMHKYFEAPANPINVKT